MGIDPRSASGQLSPDGYWRWDGTRWVPATTAAQSGTDSPVQQAAGPFAAAGAILPAAFAPPPAYVAPGYSAPAYGAPAAAAGVRRPGLVIGATASTIVGALLVGLGCILPYVHYPDTSASPVDSSVFSTGFAGTLWYAVEPVVVILAGLAGAVLLAAWPNRIARAITGGALIAFGIQTVMLFVGYAGFAATQAQIRPGGPVGLLGGVLILAGGAMAAGSLMARPPSPPTAS